MPSVPPPSLISMYILKGQLILTCHDLLFLRGSHGPLRPNPPYSITLCYSAHLCSFFVTVLNTVYTCFIGQIVCLFFVCFPHQTITSSPFGEGDTIGTSLEIAHTAAGEQWDICLYWHGHLILNSTVHLCALTTVIKLLTPTESSSR